MSAESQTYVKLPIIDISQPLNESTLSSLYAAGHEWGFFYITNHGISRDFYQNLISESNKVFSLPQETKLKVDILSYVPRFVASSFFESLKVFGPDFLASTQKLTEVFFNQKNTEFSNLVGEYGSKMTELSQKIVKMLLMSLGDGFVKKFYETEFSSCEGHLRINNYSPPDTVTKEAVGLGKHTDISCVTILFQDDIGGLQMLSKEGKWMDISPCKDALIVNIGDFMRAWSNEKLKSAEHRVVLKGNTNRISIAFFWSYEHDKEIYAPEEVVGEGKTRHYKPFSTEEYTKFRTEEYRKLTTGMKDKYEKVGANIKDFAGIDEITSIS